MKKFLSIFLPVLFYSAAFLVIFLLKAQFTSSVWEGYRVLAVPAQIEEEKVLDKLQNHGINSVLSLSLQNPVYTNPMCPVTTFGQNYADAVKSFYFDFDKAHQIYYIEENADLSRKISALLKDDVSGWKIEHISTFSRLILILPVLFSLGFFIAAKRKIMFLLMQAPFLFFCACAAAARATPAPTKNARRPAFSGAPHSCLDSLAFACAATLRLGIPALSKSALLLQFSRQSMHITQRL